MLPGMAMVLVLAACGGDDAATTTTSIAISTTTSTVAEFVCPDPIPVGNVDELLAVLETAAWESVGPYSSGSLPPTPDLVVGGTVTLESKNIPVPAGCLDRDDCRNQAVLSAVDVEGALVEGDAGLFEGDTRLTLTDTTVRLSLSMLDTHPGPFNFVPLVSVIGPCDAPCDPDEFACPADGRCYGSFDAYCRRCEGRPAAECACRAPEGPLADGTSCDYFISGDVIEVGECRAGICVVGD